MTSVLNGWYYVVPKKGMPFIQERVDNVVQENLATILAKGEYLERICNAFSTGFDQEWHKPVLIDPFNAAVNGEIVFTLTEPIMVAKVTAQVLINQ